MSAMHHFLANGQQSGDETPIHHQRDIQLFASRKLDSPEQFFARASQLCAELNITQNDMYGDFAMTKDQSPLRCFENEIATYLSKEDALFVPSGVMSQMMVLAMQKEKTSHTQFLCHYSSHLLLHEEKSYEKLLGMTPLVVEANETASVQYPMTFDQLQTKLAGVENNVAVAVLELPHRELGGKCTPLEDIVHMSQYCRNNGVHFHMDGARLWEASTGYDASPAELAALFDSVYVSFYKGLGGVTGAMLLGNKEYISEARAWLRRFGGNVFCQLPLYVSCWAGFIQNKDSFAARKARLSEVVSILKNQLLSNPTYNSVVDEMVLGEDESFFADNGTKFKPLIRFDPPKPQVPMIHIYVDASPETAILANQLAEKHTGIACFRRFMPAQYGNQGKSVTELTMGPDNMSLPNSAWIQGWSTFLAELKALKTAHA